MDIVWSLLTVTAAAGPHMRYGYSMYLYCTAVVVIASPGDVQSASASRRPVLHCRKLVILHNSNFDLLLSVLLLTICCRRSSRPQCLATARPALLPAAALH
jgi:hypothetical protein